MLFKDLPHLFFNNASFMFQNHMVKQWCSTKLLKLTISTIPQVTTSFDRWIFNLPIETWIVFSEMRNSNMV